MNSATSRAERLPHAVFNTNPRGYLLHIHAQSLATQELITKRRLQLKRCLLFVHHRDCLFLIVGMVCQEFLI